MVLLPHFSYEHDGNGLPSVNINAFGGCYKWRSEQPEVVGIRYPSSTQCDGDCPKIDSETEFNNEHNRYSGINCNNIVTVFPKNPMANDRAYIVATDQLTGEELRAEVNIAPLSSLRISTRSRRISVGVLEDIQVFGSDSQGNDFDSLQGIPFQWGIQNLKVLQKVLPPPLSSSISINENNLVKFSRGDIVTLKGIQTGETILTVSTHFNSVSEDFIDERNRKTEVAAEVRVTVVDRVAFQPSQIFVAPLWQVNLSLSMMREDITNANQRLLSLPLQHFTVREDGHVSDSSMTSLLLVNDKRTPSFFVKELELSSLPGISSILAEDERVEDNTARTRVVIVQPSLMQLAVSRLPTSISQDASDTDIQKTLANIRSEDVFPHARSPSLAEEYLPFESSGTMIYLVKGRTYRISPRLLGEETRSRLVPIHTASNIEFATSCSSATSSNCEDILKTRVQIQGNKDVVVEAKERGNGHISFSVNSISTGSFSTSSEYKKQLISSLPSVSRPFTVVDPISLPVSNTNPQERKIIVLPVGQSLKVLPAGGSGVYSLRVASSSSPTSSAEGIRNKIEGIVDVSVDGSIIARQPGVVKLIISDQNDKSNELSVSVVVWWVGVFKVHTNHNMAAVGDGSQVEITAETAELPHDVASKLGLRVTRLPFTACDAVSVESIDPCVATGRAASSRSGIKSACEIPPTMRNSQTRVSLLSSSPSAVTEVLSVPSSLPSGVCRLANVRGVSKGATTLSAHLTTSSGHRLTDAVPYDFEVFDALRSIPISKSYFPLPRRAPLHCLPSANNCPAANSTLLANVREVNLVAAVGSSLRVKLVDGPSGALGIVHSSISETAETAANSPAVSITSVSDEWIIHCLREEPLVTLTAMATSSGVSTKHSFRIGCSIPRIVELVADDAVVDNESNHLISTLNNQNEDQKIFAQSLKQQRMLKCQSAPHLIAAVPFDEFGRAIISSSSFSTSITATSEPDSLFSNNILSYSIINHEKTNSVISIKTKTDKHECFLDAQLSLVASLTAPEGNKAVYDVATRDSLHAALIANHRLGDGWTSTNHMETSAVAIVRSQVFPTEKCNKVYTDTNDGALVCELPLPVIDGWSVRLAIVGGSGFLSSSVPSSSVLKSFLGIASTGVPVPLLSTDTREILTSAVIGESKVHARILDAVAGDVISISSLKKAVRTTPEPQTVLEGKKVFDQPIQDLILTFNHPFTAANVRSISSVSIRDRLLIGGVTTTLRISPVSVASVSLSIVPDLALDPSKDDILAEFSTQLSKLKTTATEDASHLKEVPSSPSSPRRLHIQRDLLYFAYISPLDSSRRRLPLWLLPALSPRISPSASSIIQTSKGGMLLTARDVFIASPSVSSGLVSFIGVSPGVSSIEATCSDLPSVSPSQELLLEVYSPLVVRPSSLVMLPHGHTFQLSTHGGPSVVANHAPTLRVSSPGPAVILPSQDASGLPTIKSAREGHTSIIIEGIDSQGHVVASTTVSLTVAVPRSLSLCDKSHADMKSANSTTLEARVGLSRRVPACLFTQDGRSFTLPHLLFPSGHQISGLPSNAPAAVDSRCTFQWSSSDTSVVAAVDSSSSSPIGVLSAVREGGATVTVSAKCEVSGVVSHFEHSFNFVSLPPPLLLRPLLAPVTNNYAQETVACAGSCASCELNVPLASQVPLSGISPASVGGNLPVVSAGDTSLIDLEWTSPVSSTETSGSLMLTSHARTGHVSISVANAESISQIANVYVMPISDIELSTRVSGVSLATIPVGSVIPLVSRLFGPLGQELVSPSRLSGSVLSSHPSVVEVLENVGCKSELLASASSVNEKSASGLFSHPPPPLHLGCFALHARAPGCASIHIEANAVSALSTPRSSKSLLSDVISVCTVHAMMPSHAAAAGGVHAHVSDLLFFRSDVDASKWTVNFFVSPANLPTNVRAAICEASVTATTEQNAVSSAVSIMRTPIVRAVSSAMEALQITTPMSDRDIQISAERVLSNELAVSTADASLGGFFASYAFLHESCKGVVGAATGGVLLKVTIEGLAKNLMASTSVSASSLSASALENFIHQLWLSLARSAVQEGLIIDWKFGIQPSPFSPSTQLDLDGTALSPASEATVFAVSQGTATVGLLRDGTTATANVQVHSVSSANIDVSVTGSGDHAVVRVHETTGNVSFGSTPFRVSGLDLSCHPDSLPPQSASLVSVQAKWMPLDAKERFAAVSSVVCDVKVASPTSLPSDAVAAIFDKGVSVLDTLSIRLQLTSAVSPQTLSPVSKIFNPPRVSRAVSLPFHPPVLFRVSPRSPHRLSASHAASLSSLHLHPTPLANASMLFNPARPLETSFDIWIGSQSRNVAVYSTFPAALLAVSVAPANENGVSRVTLRLSPPGSSSLPSINIAAHLSFALIEPSNTPSSSSSSTAGDLPTGRLVASTMPNRAFHILSSTPLTITVLMQFAVPSSVVSANSNTPLATLHRSADSWSIQGEKFLQSESYSELTTPAEVEKFLIDLAKQYGTYKGSEWPFFNSSVGIWTVLNTAVVLTVTYFLLKHFNQLYASAKGGILSIFLSGSNHGRLSDLNNSANSNILKMSSFNNSSVLRRTPGQLLRTPSSKLNLSSSNMVNRSGSASESPSDGRVPFYTPTYAGERIIF